MNTIQNNKYEINDKALDAVTGGSGLRSEDRVFTPINVTNNNWDDKRQFGFIPPSFDAETHKKNADIGDPDDPGNIRIG